VYHCACECESTTCTGGVSCGACPQATGAPVAAGTFTKVMWDGVQRTDEDRGTFTCVRSRPVSPGRHRIAIRVYDDPDSARDMRGGRIVTQDFDLPVAGGALQVSISAVQSDPCVGPAAATARACTGGEPRETACTLPFSLSYGAEGGLVSRSRTSSIAPLAAYSLTQTFPRSTTPDQQCMATLPLCARDARVVTTSDLTRVLTNPIVTSAFGPQMPVVGYDERPVDGSIFVLRRPDGQSVGIGRSQPGAAVVPTELLEAQAILSRLDTQMLGDPACAAVTR